MLTGVMNFQPSNIYFMFIGNSPCTIFTAPCKNAAASKESSEGQALQIKVGLPRRFSNIESKNVLAVATLLDPRSKCHFPPMHL